MLYWLYKNVLIGPWLRILFRPLVEGLEHLPADGAAILASNHLSFCDSVFLPAVVHRRITFLAKAEYFTGTGIKGALSRLLVAGSGMVPIDRTSGSTAQGALETAKRILSAGELLGVYPEGTRSPDGRLYRGKTGVARMAIETGVPVIPVAMMNTDQIQPIGRLLPRMVRCRITIGAPLDFSRYDGMAGDRFVERSMTDEIMYALMQLSGKEYVDVYAAKVKADQAKARGARAALDEGGADGTESAAA